MEDWDEYDEEDYNGYDPPEPQEPLSPEWLQMYVALVAAGLEQLRAVERSIVDHSPDDLRRIDGAFKDINRVMRILLSLNDMFPDEPARVPLPRTAAMMRELERLAGVLADARKRPPVGPRAGAAAAAFFPVMHVVRALALGSPERAAGLLRCRPLIDEVVQPVPRDLAAILHSSLAALTILQETVWLEHADSVWTDAGTADSVHALAVGVARAWGRNVLAVRHHHADALKEAAPLALAFALLRARASPSSRAGSLGRRVLLLDGFGDALCEAVASCAGRIPAEPAQLPPADVGVTPGSVGSDASDANSSLFGRGLLPGHGALCLAAALAGVELTAFASVRTRRHEVGVDFSKLQEEAGSGANADADAAGPAAVPELAALLLERAPALPERLAAVLRAARPWCQATLDACGGGGASRAAAAAGAAARQGRDDDRCVALAAGLGRLFRELLQFPLAALAAVAPALADRPDIVAPLSRALVSLARAGLAAAGVRPGHRGQQIRDVDRDAALAGATAAAGALRRLASPRATPASASG